ncbi:MBL fold metallo-hydrolase [uncultured Chitinophaga sp.]|jgi:Predicted Zn-dependent hydrolases of the beta-lactamase fold|uniref:MBL fold metallo-hydrolase n=1 Tax=uncultured Chitinophaga sp. TaxID=339340 RepID=UPI0026104EDA|nr:MBL fold metallo-hydrolase [uncultured Chitinophaga sp.]
MKFRNLALTLLLISAKALAQQSSADTLQTAKGVLSIQPVQHASLVLTVESLTIYADPDGGGDKYKGYSEPDIILITDIHGDHFNPATIAAVKTVKTLLVVPQAVADKLTAEDRAKAIVLRNGEQTTQAGITITAIPMYNPPGGPDAKHPKGRGNGYVLNIGGKNIYLSGDTEDIPEMRALKNIDVAFVCMNLPYTMDVNHAADAVLAFKPRVVYPYHYRGQNGLSDVNVFKRLVEEGNKNITVRLRNWYN